MPLSGCSEKQVARSSTSTVRPSGAGSDLVAKPPTEHAREDGAARVNVRHDGTRVLLRRARVEHHLSEAAAFLEELRQLRPRPHPHCARGLDPELKIWRRVDLFVPGRPTRGPAARARRRRSSKLCVNQALVEVQADCQPVRWPRCTQLMGAPTEDAGPAHGRTPDCLGWPDGGECPLAHHLDVSTRGSPPEPGTSGRPSISHRCCSDLASSEDDETPLNPF
eukprot:scaffold20725_cov111-Isochrysis_galbana.AAC.4